MTMRSKKTKEIKALLVSKRTNIMKLRKPNENESTAKRKVHSTRCLHEDTGKISY